MKFVILDRDGVINYDSADYIKSVTEWYPITGSIEAIARLHNAGFVVTVATNQSGLARGLFTQNDLDAIHRKLIALVEQAGGVVDGIFFCPHLPEQNCSCRKPATGMLQQIEQHFSASLDNAFFVGDSMKDIEAALAFGCRPILVRTGKGAATEAELELAKLRNVPVFADLASAVDQLILAADV
jgi:D-glycero-D-manno-heptose 1,7-bisphosphate phosphatase